MFLFVYGTLRRGFGGEMATKLATESEWIGQVKLARAKLYRVQTDSYPIPYPALALIGDGDPQSCDHKQDQAVIGDLIRLRKPEQTIRWLDEYEECGPEFEPSEYVRREVRVKGIESGQIFSTTTYVWNLPIRDGDGQLIEPIRELVEGGDWLKYIKQQK